MRPITASIALLGVASFLALGCGEQSTAPVEGLSLTRANDVVTVCHVRGNGVYAPLDVDQASLPAHLQHGDGQPGGPVPGINDSEFASDCSIIFLPDATVIWNSSSADARIAGFGPGLSGSVSGDGVDVGDACSPLTPASLSGDIAIIARGTCFFSTKVYNVQQAGAIGAVVYNVSGQDDLVQMSAGTNDPITIPSVFVGYSDGQAILSALTTTVEITP